MNLVYLRLENFLSFKELYHEFISGAVLVQGKNLTEIESKETNGAGKSSMGAAIAKAVLDNALRKQVVDADLITWGEEEAHIWLTMYCPIRKQTLEIHRTLRVKGGASLELKVNEARVQVATLKDGNNYILNWIGITSEDLRNYYFINKENFKSFVSSSNTDKLSLISRFIKADALDEVDDIVKAKNAPINEQIEAALVEVNTVQGELNAYTTQLENEKGRDLEAERDQQMQSYIDRVEDIATELERHQKDIENCNLAIEESNKTIAKAQETIDVTNKKLSKLESISFEEKYSAIDKERATADKALAEARQEINEVKNLGLECEAEIKQLETFLKGAITCPKCGHHFVPDSDVELTVEEAQAKIRENREAQTLAEVDMEELNDQFKKLADRVAEFDKKFVKVRTEEQENVSAMREVQKLISQLKGDVDRSNARIKMYRAQIADNEKKISRCAEEADYIEAQANKLENQPLINPRVDELEEQIALANVKLKKREKTVDAYRELVAKNTQWGLRLKEFKMSLAVEQLKIIQNFANRSLQQQKSELRVAIEGFKKDSKGKVKSEITVYVINGDGEYKSFWSFSGGERARIEISLIIAMAEMINSTNKWGGLHFLQIDEVLEGTDPLGLSLLVESLSDFTYPIYIISHVMNIKTGVKTLTIVKEKGYSYVE